MNSYQCTYRAVTFHEGKKSETVMRYSFQKPDRIRMDIEKPKKGAVLIYNPKVSEKVKVRPFPKMPFFILSYDLTSPRVSSGSGGTLDRSDLGHRIESFCSKVAISQPNADHGCAQFPEQNGEIARWCFSSASDLPLKIEILNKKNEVQETFEWTDLKINLEFKSDFFERF